MRFMFLGILGAYLLGNLYIFIKGWNAFSALVHAMQLSRGGTILFRGIFSVAFWFVAVSLFISLFSRNVEIPAWLQGGMYNIGSVWMAFTLYMVLALLAVDLLRGVAALCGGPLQGFGAGLRQYGFWGALIFTVLLLIGGYINYMNPKVEEVDITLKPHQESSSAHLNGVATSSTDDRQESVGKQGGKARIVAISDVHLGYATDKKQLQRYVKLINSLSPDIILIAGDLIDNSVLPVRQQRMQEELGQLVAPGGIYMVPGNHEYISGSAEVEEFLAETPIELLRDSVIAFPDGLCIVGRDDRSNRERLAVEQLLQKCAADSAAKSNTDEASLEADEPEQLQLAGPVILLDHQPYGIAENVALGVDLQISGHTHHGQVWPMSLMVEKMYEQSHGYRQWGDSHVIVSSGLSLWGPPFRIGTHSDLFLINLRY